MAYEPKNYSQLVGMTGFSETLLKNHFTLYQGYVTNINKLDDTLTRLRQEGNMAIPEYAELKRRFGWEYNGVRLHEYYFENLGGTSPTPQEGRLTAKIDLEFGSYDEWEKDFKATGAMRGIG